MMKATERRNSEQPLNREGAVTDGPDFTVLFEDMRQNTVRSRKRKQTLDRTHDQLLSKKF